MYYVYVLRSLADGNMYTGATNNLQRRLEEHKKGYVESTARRLPVELVYYEACIEAEDAYRREKYLKSGNGKKYLCHRIESYWNKTPTG